MESKRLGRNASTGEPSYRRQLITDWLGQANGGFADNSAAASQPLNTGFTIAGVGDFNGDHKADMLLEWSDGSLQTWTGSASGAILSPVEKVWTDAVAGLGGFLSEITNQLETATPPPASKSGGSGERYLPNAEFTTDMNAIWDGGPYTAYTNDPVLAMTWGSDYSFDLLSRTDTGFTASYGDGNVGSMTVVDSATGDWSFHVNGVEVNASWMPGAPPTPPAAPSSPLGNSIIVTGHLANSAPWQPAGYFNISPVGIGLNFGDGFGGEGSVGPGATGPEAVHLSGGTPLDQVAARSALALLYKNSPTAHALIDAVVANGTVVNLINANLTGQGQQNGFYADTKQLYWDPFEVVWGYNTNGTSYYESPIMLLAHELVHAAHADDPNWQLASWETTVIAVANQVAGEMNTATGTHQYDTSRDNEVRAGLYDTTSTTSTTYSIARPKGG